MRIGYLVNYSSGDYEDYRVTNDSVYFNKDEAYKRCKELDELHFGTHSLYTGKSFNDIDDEVTDIIGNTPELQLHGDVETWSKQLEKINPLIRKLTFDITRKYYPDWSDKDIEIAQSIESTIDYDESCNYGEAMIEEIEIYD
jgi:hypothetical protein